MKTVLFVILMLLPMVISAESVEIDGINYDVITKGKIAKVIAKSPKYRGNIVIPSNIIVEGVECNVTVIDDKAFYECTDLIEVVIPSTITNIGKFAFWGCSGMSSITIPSSVKTIEKGAFQNCTKITSVAIPSSITEIGEYAFSNCTNLVSLKIPESITEIKDYLFAGCIELTSIILPPSVTIIGCGAFDGCQSLTSVIIPMSVTSIKQLAFQGCNSLSSLTVPSSVTNIERCAFTCCSGLTSIVVEEGNLVYDSRNQCNAIIRTTDNTLIAGCNNTVIPTNITAIDDGAFSMCKELISVTIPEGVIYINDYAFSECTGITRISIPSTVQRIGDASFWKCEELAEVFCYAKTIPSIVPWGINNPFEGSYIEFSTLHVPASAINSYRTTEPWSKFGTILAIDGEEPVMNKCAKPTICYINGQLLFHSETEGAECVSTISNADIKTHYGNEISLTATYNVSVYATASGYENSDVATATLCWLDAEPKTEGMASNIATARGNAVLIQSHDGILRFSGVENNTSINVYTSTGMMIGTAKVSGETTSIATGLRNGDIAIIKIGTKSVKVVVR